MTTTPPASPIGAVTTVELPGGTGGRTFVPASAPLIGLNYFDGRFLRADDLNLEHRGQRAYVDYSNQAGGSGVVWGFELSGLGSPTLALAAGLAIAPGGRVLHLPEGVVAGVAELLAAAVVSGPSASGTGFAPCAADLAAPVASVVPGGDRYLVCLAPASGLCGQSDVFGRLCDDGCVSAADRPYVVDGVTLLLRPLTVDVGRFDVEGLTREVHLRSQLAAAYFEDERLAAGSRLSAAGLAAGLWGAGATSQAGDDAVPVGVLAWDGSRITLLDIWTARRERMEAPPRAYWAGRLEQRPWPVFLAQVLQFQSSLAAAVDGPVTVPARILVERGFVDLPAAGYLPVVKGEPDLRPQLQDLFGPGVDLRLCAVRQDQIPHELERAQHMRRISLVDGIADAAKRELVDVLVPDGITESVPGERTGIGFSMDLVVGSGVDPVVVGVADPKRVRMAGAARVEFDRAVNARFAVAGSALAGLEGLVEDLLAGVLRPGRGPDEADLRRRRMRPAPLSTALLKEVAGAVLAGIVRHRAEGSTARAAAVDGTRSRFVAAAVALSVLDDPFELGGSKQTAFELTVELSVPREAPITVFARLRGLLTGRAPAPGDPPGRAVLDVLAGVTLDVAGISGIEVPDQPAVQLTVVAHRGEQDGQRYFAVTDETERVVAAAFWQGDPISASGLLAFVLGGDRTLTDLLGDLGPFGPRAPVGAAPLTFTATEDPGIGRPGGTYHEAAVGALGILAGAHPTEPSYAEQQYRLLFPPDAAALTSRVRAATDWVLFRRRRREDCEGAAAPPPPVLSPVTAWILRVDGVDEVDGVVADIRGGDWPADGWERADVLFEAGVTTLLTPAEAWQDRYADAGGAARIAFAGYGGTEGADALTVGIGRLGALLSALTPVAEPDVGVIGEFANQPPGIRLVPGTDGSAFFVTYPPGPPPDPDRLDVVGVVMDGVADQLGDDLLAGTGFEPGPRFLALGEGTTGDIDGDRIVAEALLLGNPAAGLSRTVRTVVWTCTGLDGTARAAMETLAGQVVDALKARTELSALTSATAVPDAFERAEGGPAARLFVIVNLSFNEG